MSGASVLIALLTALPASATAATFTVTSNFDGAEPGPAGSLRAAINSANTTAGADTIVFDPGLSGTILLTGGQLSLNDASGATTITGPGANVLTVSGNHASRVFSVAGAGGAISGLTIADGVSDGGGGLLNFGVLVVRGCIFRDNVENFGYGGGGLHNAAGGTLTLSDSLFVGNQAIYGGAIEQFSSIPAVLTNVTMTGNVCLAGDSGIVEVYGGAIRLESCTIANNAQAGAGAVCSNLSGGTIEYRNTIVAGNGGVQFTNPYGGLLTSLGHNLSSDGTGNLAAAGDLPNTDPLLGPLADNGGTTMTFALLSGSPAIDAGDLAVFPATDQRAVVRPLAVMDCSSVPDIGAFELQPVDCNQNGIADGCDFAAPHIYWSNDTSNLIQRGLGLPTNQNLQTVVSTGTVLLRGVAVDIVHHTVYWSDITNNVVKRSNLDGSGVAILISGTAGAATDVTLDVAGGWMYSANPFNGSIYRADLNGGGLTALVTGQTGVSGVALDPAGGKMYWTNQNGTNGAIRRANLDGTNIETLISSGLNSPIDIALDVADGRMYWAEFGGNRIRRANLDGTGIDDLAIGVTNATSVALDPVANKLYWSSSTLQKIQRANPDGTGVEDVVAGVGAIFRIAFVPESADCNGNSVPDECEPALHLGDLNCDCAFDINDLPDFVDAVLDPAGFSAAHPTCSFYNADMQPDGAVDGLDIQEFVIRLTQ